MDHGALGTLLLDTHLRQRSNRRGSGNLMKQTVLGIMLLALFGAYAQSPHQIAIVATPDAAPLAVDRGAAGLWQTLKKLHTRASLLMVTAHPDDEDGGMLAYESRGQGARVALLTLNRGEGGANVMSPDFFDALGLVRTEELLAAGRYYGVQQYWTRVIDYGFSKTKEEALGQWTHDRVLADVVRVIRMNRPLVITSVFMGGPSDGHGNHQVAGQMAKEAFDAAGDPSKFPEQIQAGLRPWTVLKDYARPRGTTSFNVQIPVGEYDPVIGQTYAQVARQGLGFQKSQNGGTGPLTAGEQYSTYHRFGSVIPASDKETSFFDGIDISLGGIATLVKSGDAEFLKKGLAHVNEIVEAATAAFHPAQPGKIAPQLAAGWKATDVLIEQVRTSSLTAGAKADVTYELEIKRAQFNSAINQALGMSLQATAGADGDSAGGRGGRGGGPQASFQTVIPGQAFVVQVHVVNQGAEPAKLSRLSLTTPQGENWTTQNTAVPAEPLSKGKAADWRIRVTVPAGAGFTRPYFTRPNIEQTYYDLKVPEYLNRPLSPYPVSAWLDYTYDGANVRLGQVVQAVARVTGPGTVMNPLIVAPAVSVAMAPSAGVAPLDGKSFKLSATIHSNVKGPAEGKLRLDLPAGWKSAPATAAFTTAKDGDEQSLVFQVTPAKLEEKPYAITAVAEYGGREYKEGYRTVGYAGLRPYNLYRPSDYRTTGVNVKMAAGLKIGYIEGSGDDVPQALESLGVKVTFLTASDLAGGDLRKFDVIVLGVRAYAVREDLKTNNARLIDYVKAGGVAIVQYNTPEYDHNYGPYPYTMGGNPEEVTDEASAVQILNPRNPVFTWPNKITAKDFERWVEERGSKFLRAWDDHYEALLEMHDAGQEPQKGGLVYARYGKGVYIYNAYAFYRQLPEGVPGAFRIFANLLSLPRHPEIAPKPTPAAAAATKK